MEKRRDLVGFRLLQPSALLTLLPSYLLLTPRVISLDYTSMIIANSSQKSGYFQHLKQSDQIFSGSSVR